jgi:hypothetical protein
MQRPLHENKPTFSVEKVREVLSGVSHGSHQPALTENTLHLYYHEQLVNAENPMTLKLMLSMYKSSLI